MSVPVTSTDSAPSLMSAVTAISMKLVIQIMVISPFCEWLWDYVLLGLVGGNEKGTLTG
jgi:hypothetical protein